VREDYKPLADFLGVTVDEMKEKHLEEIEKFNTKLMRPKLRREKGKPYGPCLFYSEKNGCAVHDAKPLECKVGNCSKHSEDLSLWFTLNYYLNENDPESIRQFAAYLNSGGKTLDDAELKHLVPDEKKLKKILNYEIIK
jgi:hypothetical protein